VAYERLATHNRQVKRTVLVDEGEDAVDEFLALEVSDLTEC
jgi:hypothetical protein